MATHLIPWRGGNTPKQSRPYWQYYQKKGHASPGHGEMLPVVAYFGEGEGGKSLLLGERVRNIGVLHMHPFMMKTMGKDSTIFACWEGGLGCKKTVSVLITGEAGKGGEKKTVLMRRRKRELRREKKQIAVTKKKGEKNIRANSCCGQGEKEGVEAGLQKKTVESHKAEPCNTSREGEKKEGEAQPSPLSAREKKETTSLPPTSRGKR